MNREQGADIPLAEQAEAAHADAQAAAEVVTVAEAAVAQASSLADAQKAQVRLAEAQVRLAEAQARAREAALIEENLSRLANEKEGALQAAAVEAQRQQVRDLISRQERNVAVKRQALLEKEHETDRELSLARAALAKAEAALHDLERALTELGGA